MLWRIELKFCIWLCFNVLKIKCPDLASILEGVMPLFQLSVYKIRRFLHFSPACFDTLSWNFVWLFLMYYITNSSVVTLRQFLKVQCLSLNLEYRKYTVFCIFLLHALTHWIEILKMTLFYCTTYQVRVSSFCVNFRRSYASFWTQNVENMQCSALFSYMLRHIELTFCIWLCLNVPQIKFECCYNASNFERVMPLRI